MPRSSVAHKIRRLRVATGIVAKVADVAKAVAPVAAEVAALATLVKNEPKPVVRRVKPIDAKVGKTIRQTKKAKTARKKTSLP